MTLKIFEKEHRKKTIISIISAIAITVLITILLVYLFNVIIPENGGGGT